MVSNSSSSYPYLILNWHRKVVVATRIVFIWICMSSWFLEYGTPLKRMHTVGICTFIHWFRPNLILARYVRTYCSIDGPTPCWVGPWTLGWLPCCWRSLVQWEHILCTCITHPQAHSQHRWTNHSRSSENKLCLTFFLLEIVLPSWQFKLFSVSPGDVQYKYYRRKTLCSSLGCSLNSNTLWNFLCFLSKYEPYQESKLLLPKKSEYYSHHSNPGICLARTCWIGWWLTSLFGKDAESF